MKQTIRSNTFETNSSSTHSCVILTKEEYDKWQNNGYLDNGAEPVVFTKDELKAKFKAWREQNPGKYGDSEDSFNTWCLEFGYYTVDTWGGDYEFDRSVRQIDGKPIYVCCYFGWDG